MPSGNNFLRIFTVAIDVNITSKSSKSFEAKKRSRKSQSGKIGGNMYLQEGIVNR